jgi:hypothetical protein
MEQKQELSQFAKVKYQSLKEANPHLPEEELEQMARSAAEAATQMFGEMVESGADPWAVREQILNDLSQPTTPGQPKESRNT